jgi:hypothetical protein
MKRTSTKDQVWLGFHIKTQAGPLPRPQQIRIWNENDFKSQQPQAPFHYFSDALMGLGLVHLNPHLKNPLSTPQMNFPFCHEAWRALEPHHELYEKSQPRVRALQEKIASPPSVQPLMDYFERHFSETLEEANRPWGIELTHLAHLLEAVDYLETKMDQPLLYNFQIKFSKETVEKLQYLHTLLFNLRSLIALDHNAHTQDVTHQGCKVDSITDYLSKAEYVSNDALLFWNFCKQKQKMPSETFRHLEKQFRTYSHNGVCLIENLPQSFLSSLSTAELEEALYIVQMDWLLAADAGLLFRVREEIYGLIDGYENIFWPDLKLRGTQKTQTLNVNCHLDLETLYPSQKVA